jgi:hypothetical protein
MPQPQYDLTNAFPKLTTVNKILINGLTSTINSLTNAFPLLERVQDLTIEIHSTTSGYLTMFPQLSEIGSDPETSSFSFRFISHESNAVLPNFLNNIYTIGDCQFRIENSYDVESASVIYPLFQALQQFSYLDISAYGAEMSTTWSGAFPSLETCGDLILTMNNVQNLNNFAPLLVTINSLYIQAMTNLQDITNSFSSLTTVSSEIVLNNLKITNLDTFANLQSCAAISLVFNQMLTNIFTGLGNINGSSVQYLLIANNPQLSTSQTDLLLNNYLSEGFSGYYEIYGNSD